MNGEEGLDSSTLRLLSTHIQWSLQSLLSSAEPDRESSTDSRSMDDLLEQAMAEKLLFETAFF